MSLPDFQPPGPLPVTELLLYFLGGPALGLLAYLVFLATSSELQGTSDQSTKFAKLVLASMGLPALLYGIILMAVSAPVQTDSSTSGLLRDVALSFSTVALLTLAGMSFQVRRMVPAIEKNPKLLGRNLVLLIMPQGAVVFGLVLAITQLGYIISSLEAGSLQPEAVTTSVLWGYLIAVGGLASAVLAGAAGSMESGRDFVRHIVWGIAAVWLSVVGLALGLGPLRI